MLKRIFTINCSVGLHARPAAVLVTEASKFKSQITIQHKEKTSSIKTIIGVMTLGVKSGAEVELSVDGPDEEAALERLTRFFEEEILSL